MQLLKIIKIRPSNYFSHLKLGTEERWSVLLEIYVHFKQAEIILKNIN